jgi:hypothetical protein
MEAKSIILEDNVDINFTPLDSIMAAPNMEPNIG